MESFVSSDSQPLNYKDFENDDCKDANSQRKTKIFSLSKSIPLQLSYGYFQPLYYNHHIEMHGSKYSFEGITHQSDSLLHCFEINLQAFDNPFVVFLE